jgi:hypothetical protein
VSLGAALVAFTFDESKPYAEEVMRIHRLVAATLAALIVSVSGSIAPRQAVAANNSSITIALTATVDWLTDPYNLLGGAVHVGDTITGSYTYNGATSDTNTASYVGDYRHTTAPYGVSLTVDGLVFETDPQKVNFLIEIVNNSANWDYYLIDSSNNRPLSNGVGVRSIRWQLSDPSQTALKSTDLPRSAPRLSDWTVTASALLLEGDTTPGPSPGGGDGFSIQAHVTQAQKVNR